MTPYKSHPNPKVATPHQSDHDCYGDREQHNDAVVDQKRQHPSGANAFINSPVIKTTVDDFTIQSPRGHVFSLSVTIKRHRGRGGLRYGLEVVPHVMFFKGRLRLAQVFSD